jgi:3-methyl-2-oxobutanoate hydroxymethyltransferase
MGRMSLTRLRDMKAAGERIACLTAYDASFAALMEEAGVELLLVGDSLGMVIQGHDTTLPVTLAEMIYHTRCVVRGSRAALIVADLPFASYATPAQALGNAARLMREGGAQVVKLEGARVEVVAELARHGIPVCAHLGLLPQSVHKLGGYKVQGRGTRSADDLLADALALEAAGADLLVLECIPQELAARVTGRLRIPVIGIGAGPGCDGQVLVCYDLLGVASGRAPRFVKNFLAQAEDLRGAFSGYVDAVKAGTFPGPEHSFD